MSNPPGPDQPDNATDQAAAADDVGDVDDVAGGEVADSEHEPATEIMTAADPEPADADEPAERRFTAPSGFDAGSTQKIESPPNRPPR